VNGGSPATVGVSATGQKSPANPPSFLCFLLPRLFSLRATAGVGCNGLWPQPAAGRWRRPTQRPRPPTPFLLFLPSPHFSSSPAHEIQRAGTHGSRRRSWRCRGTTSRSAHSPEGECAAVEQPLGGAVPPRPRVTRTVGPLSELYSRAVSNGPPVVVMTTGEPQVGPPRRRFLI
jgi:hypothetical protein